MSGNSFPTRMCTITTSAKPKHAPFPPPGNCHPITTNCGVFGICCVLVAIGSWRHVPTSANFPMTSLKKFFLEDNCFTILCWFLPYINMNQPQVYIYPLPLEPPSPRPPHSTLPWLGNLVILDTVATLLKLLCFLFSSLPLLFLLFQWEWTWQLSE